MRTTDARERVRIAWPVLRDQLGRWPSLAELAREIGVHGPTAATHADFLGLPLNDGRQARFADRRETKPVRRQETK